MAQFKIFVVEDDPWSGELINYHLSQNPDYEVTVFTTAKECLENLYSQPDVICIDYGLPDMTGNKLLEKIQAFNKDIPVVVISGQSDISVAVNLLKSGASDYLIKDDNMSVLLWNAIAKIREKASLKQQVDGLKAQLEQKYDFEKSIIGQSAAVRKTFALIEKAIKSNINVSITGETGTGKEVVAKAIHYNSERKKKPFVAVNMAAIPNELMESELFGHEKGAFTGAAGRKIGKFEEAQGGTIFLDEIAELDLNLQSKILRVLQEREVTRVGGNEKVKLDFRLITATHKDLANEVQKGNFREDLYFRIIGLPIVLPPLRERENDVLILAKHFIGEYARENNTKPLPLSAEAKDKLLQYSFPGNIRELKAIIDLACVLSDGEEISAEDITYTSVKSEEPFKAVEKTLHEYNCEIIQYYLNKYNKNVVLVANKLGIGKSTIYNLIKNKEVVV
ncbi:sigma-54-dependent transcriptional regulator [Pontibacter cellulosilyticus]|uniref:Sigma-54-dependent Fis family transcriptional regulator n=1 Tax=Pontibacter cellulosilyticus TaxID=1720253 RepID=A0A923N3D9_9BACT|nr:sigma-54 dependent transcriptional regulator [Pontibacter cellulosilyticus]MBC5991429.1 sigma-54-dependent Fis family transcriptional regulator [Pontibacter cellulosilyticus]